MGGKREGGGRPKGSKNKIQKHIRELCKDYTEDGVRMLVHLAFRSRSDFARIAALQELFNRAWGKPAASLRISGDPDAPVNLVHSMMTPAQAAEEYAKTLENRTFAIEHHQADTDEEEQE